MKTLWKKKNRAHNASALVVLLGLLAALTGQDSPRTGQEPTATASPSLTPSSSPASTCLAIRFQAAGSRLCPPPSSSSSPGPRRCQGCPSLLPSAAPAPQGVAFASTFQLAPQRATQPSHCKPVTCPFRPGISPCSPTSHTQVHTTCQPRALSLHSQRCSGSVPSLSLPLTASGASPGPRVHAYRPLTHAR